MTANIQVRGYVVGFGDCILLSIPDDQKTCHILIDFGRAPNDPSSLERFPQIADDIAKQCNGHLDLLVMTHEHLDHLEGFYRQRDVFDKMTVERVWMGLPSNPEYYANYPKAELQKKLRANLSNFASAARRNGLILHPAFQSLIENNLANKDRVDYLRKLGRKPIVYLARGKSKAAGTPFNKIKIQVLAPEPDVSVYYSAAAQDRAITDALATTVKLATQPRDRADGIGSFDWSFPKVERAGKAEFGGLSVSDYERLRRAIKEEGVTAARFIDRAQNNTSLCLLIEGAGRRLLLPGDAELESWQVMHKKVSAAFKPVDFLKVAHHGSHNGTPLDLLDKLLPVKRKAAAQVLVSTKRDVYGTKNPVPDQSLLVELKKRCRKLVTTDGVKGIHVDLLV